MYFNVTSGVITRPLLGVYVCVGIQTVCTYGRWYILIVRLECFAITTTCFLTQLFELGWVVNVISCINFISSFQTANSTFYSIVCFFNQTISNPLYHSSHQKVYIIKQNTLAIQILDQFGQFKISNVKLRAFFSSSIIGHFCLYEIFYSSSVLIIFGAGQGPFNSFNVSYPFRAWIANLYSAYVFAHT